MSLIYNTLGQIPFLMTPFIQSTYFSGRHQLCTPPRGQRMWRFHAETATRKPWAQRCVAARKPFFVDRCLPLGAFAFWVIEERERKGILQHGPAHGLPWHLNARRF